MNIINTEERRKYFQSFKCEVLTANLKNKELIKGFVSKKANNQFAYGTSEFGDRIDTLFELSDKRLDVKKEAKKTGQVENWRVEKCVSAIE